MTADILQFIPRPNPNRTNPIEIMAVEILKDETFKVVEDIDHMAETVIIGALADDFIVPGAFADTTPEYRAPEKDPA